MRIPTVISVLALITLVSSPARAGDGIVLESYTGARPANANELMAPMLEELAARGFVTGADGVGRSFEARVSRPVASAHGLPGDFGDKIERGHRAWIAGTFDESVAILGPLVDTAHANTGALARDQALRDRMLKALIALALSQHRLGDPSAARQTFGEVLRSYPEAQVPRGTYGPDAHSLFEQLRKELTAGARGRLLVKLTDEQAEVYINGRLERRGTTVKELLPGEYRVLARLGAMESRLHKVIVKPGADATITIDLAFDGVIHSAPWAGFEFATAAARDKAEASYAAAFANAIDGRAVVVIGLDEVRGRPAIVGSLVELMNGRETRRASIALDPPPSRERFAALAKFLAGEEASPGIEVELDGAALPPLTPGARDRDDATGSRRWGGWSWIAGGTAIAALGTGAVLLVLDGSCPDSSSDPNCPNVYNTAAPGWIAVGGGVVLAGVTAYLIVSNRPARPARAAYVVPTAGGAVAGFAARF